MDMYFKIIHISDDHVFGTPWTSTVYYIMPQCHEIFVIRQED